MKKLLLYVLILNLLAMTVLPACQSAKPSPTPQSTPAPQPAQTARPNPTAQPGPAAGKNQTPPPAQTAQPSQTPQKKGPFTFDYPLNESNIGFFTQGDTIGTLLSAGPFYTGSQPLPSQATRDYDAARAKKIAEIIKEADTLAQTAVRLKPQLATMRSAFLSYLSTGLKEEPKLADFTKQTFNQVAALASREQFVETEYNSMASAGVASALAKSFMDYTKVEKAVELGGLYLQDANNMLAYAAIAIKVTQSHPNATVKKASDQLDKDMLALDSIRNDLLAATSSIQKIEYGMKQLFTGGYYLSQSANDFMAASLPDLKTKAASLTPRPGLTAEQIQAVKAYLSLIEKWQSQVKQRTDSLDKSRLVAVSQPQQKRQWLVFTRIANAAEPPDNYASAVGSVSAPLQSDPPKKDDPGYLAKGWNIAKTAFHGAQTVAGVTLDTANAVTQNTFRTYWGVWYGEHANTILEDHKKNWAEVKNNYNNSTSGVQTLKTAGEYLEGVETTARETVESGVEKATGGFGVTSWATGAITQATVGMFTGLGKGLYKLADRQADATRLAEGGLDVGLSLIGGSKVILKGSQVPNLVRGLAGEVEMTGKMAVNYVESTVAESARKNLLKESAELLAKSHLTEREAAKLISNTLEIEAKEQLARGLAAVRERMTLEMTQIVKTGGATALASAKETVKSSLEDMLKEQFTKSMNGILQAIGKVVGTSAKDYLDNLVGGWADDMIKVQVTAMVEKAAADAAAAGVFKLVISPQTVDLVTDGKQEFKVTVTGTSISPLVQWSAADGGIPFPSNGLSVTYTATTSVGSHKLVATATVGGRTEQATATVNVVTGVWVLTGTTSSTTLNPPTSNVNPPSKVNVTAGAGAIAIAYEGPDRQRGKINVVSKWRCTWTDPPARIKAGDMARGTTAVEATVGSTLTLSEIRDLGGIGNNFGTGTLTFVINGQGQYPIAGAPFGPPATFAATPLPKSQPGGYEFRTPGHGEFTLNAGCSVSNFWTSGYNLVTASVLYTYELKAP